MINDTCCQHLRLGMQTETTDIFSFPWCSMLLYTNMEWPPLVTPVPNSNQSHCPRLKSAVNYKLRHFYLNKTWSPSNRWAALHRKKTGLIKINILTPPKKSVFKDSHNFKILPYKSSKSLKLQYLEEYKPSILKYFHNQKYFVKPCIHIFSAEYIVSKDKRGFGVHTHFSES